MAFTLESFDEAKKAWNITASLLPALDIRVKEFNDALLFALSLLREVVGKIDVFPSDATPAQIASEIRVEWDIFPPGKRTLKEEVSRKILQKNAAEQKIILDRAGTIEELKPIQYVIGSGLSSNYYGALFADDLVVFENLDYGNATYILYENWHQLSQMSRTQLLSGKKDFDRIIHGTNWPKHLKEMVAHRMSERKPKRR